MAIKNIFGSGMVDLGRVLSQVINTIEQWNGFNGFGV